MSKNYLDFVKDIVEKSDQKQGNNINVLDVAEVTSLADYFIIMDVKNTRLMEALVDELVEVGIKDQMDTCHIEGKSDSEWVLLDFGAVVVHLFTPEKRKFYNLDRLWQQAKSIDLKEWLDVNV